MPAGRLRLVTEGETIRQPHDPLVLRSPRGFGPIEACIAANHILSPVSQDDVLRRGMRRCIRSVLVALVGLAPTPAMACRVYVAAADLSVIHTELPRPLPADAFAAEVRFEQPDAGWPELWRGARVRVTRVIQGEYSGEIVIFRDRPNAEEIRFMCYAPIRYGGVGLILARPAGYENGLLVLQPIFQPPRLGR